MHIQMLLRPIRSLEFRRNELVAGDEERWGLIAAWTSQPQCASQMSPLHGFSFLPIARQHDETNIITPAVTKTNSSEYITPSPTHYICKLIYM